MSASDRPLSVRYFDHAATTWPRPPQVLEAVSRVLAEDGASPGRGSYDLAVRSGRVLAGARSALADYFGVTDADDLAFMPSCTYGCNLMLKGVLRPGDRVVVGSTEHNAVARPLRVLESQGVIVDVVASDPTGLVDPDDVERAVASGPVRAVVCQHASNVTGVLQPIGDMADIAHEHDAVMLVDGAQAVGHVPVDLRALGVDAYAMAGHKGLLGVPGTGLLYLSRRIEPTTLVEGGTGGGASEDDAMPRSRPEYYEAGTANVPGAVGMAEGVGLLGGELSQMHETHVVLIRVLHEGLLALGFDVLGPDPGVERVPLLSVIPPDGDAERLAFELDRRYAIACRSGLHCAPWAHRSVTSSSSGAVRFSLGWNTTAEDVEYLLGALESLRG